MEKIKNLGISNMYSEIFVQYYKDYINDLKRQEEIERMEKEKRMQELVDSWGRATSSVKSLSEAMQDLAKVAEEERNASSSKNKYKKKKDPRFK